MGQKILLVEDSPMGAELTTYALKQCDIDIPVVHAVDGGVALWYMAVESNIALVLLDLRLRIISGIEFLTRLRAHPKHADLPVIILSGSTDLSDREQTAHLGSSGFVLKDTDIHAFTRSLCDVLAPFQAKLSLQ